MARTQITLEPEQHRHARQRAAALGVSLAEYVRRLVARDIAAPERTVDLAAVLDLGDSQGSDVARRKDEYLAQAYAAGRPSAPGKRARRR